LLLEKVRDADKIEASQTEGINSLLLGWQFLSRFGNIPQLPAMEAIDLPMVVEEKVKPNMPNPSENFTEMLPGEVVLDYLLAQQAWKLAEKETLKMMFKIMGENSEESYLSDNHLENFPRNELKIIDQLWRQYSNEKFGFSIQKKIWIDCGGQEGLYSDSDIFLRLGEKIGWRRREDISHWSLYNYLTNNLIEAPQGHRPCLNMHLPNYSTALGLSDCITWNGLLSLFSSLNYEEQE
jgi:hypothetical protein